ncbi:MAG: esterase family protein [Cyanosarcina radialis HA8281-LM2]|nr:esterase family protein [Cyanosarcina radialis HA8281-LM2]
MSNSVAIDKRKKQVIIASSIVGMLCLLAAGGAWYLLNPDTPQLDGPQTREQVKDPRLSYQIQTYTSQVMGGKRTYGVTLPPDYAQNPQKRYPVIFLLHGGNGKPTDWFKKGAALPVIEKLYKSGKLPHSIIITPDGNDKRGPSPFYDPQYINGENGNVSTAIGEELVKVIQSRYRTLPAPKFWAMGGLSSGGWGALNVGLHHPDRFSILFSHSGYFRDRFGPQNSPIIYINRVPQEVRSRLRIYLDAGSDDGKYLQQTQEFAGVLKQLKISHVANEFPGGHNLVGPDSLWNYWHKHLADSLTYVGKQFREAEANKSKVSQPAASK